MTTTSKTEPFAQIPTYLLQPGRCQDHEDRQQIARLSTGCLLHYGNLSSYAFGKRNKCIPGLARLAADAGVTIRTIQRWNRQLVKAGLLEIERRLQEMTTNLYTILQKAGIVQMACDPAVAAGDRTEPTMRSVEVEDTIPLPHEEQKEQEEKGEEEPIQAQSPLPLPVDIQARTHKLIEYWESTGLCAMGCELLGISSRGWTAYVRVPDASDPHLAKLLPFVYMRLRGWNVKRLVYGE